MKKKLLILCSYGCNKEAKFFIGKNKKPCCSKSYNSCEFLRKKNSEILKKAYKEGKRNSNHLIKYCGWAKGLNHKTDSRIFHKKDEEVFQKVMIKNSSYSRGHLKTRLLSSGIKKNECEICGFKGLWNNKKIVFILDHINGINNDHRLENLRIVCPMCNTQLETFCSRNIVFKKKKL